LCLCGKNEFATKTRRHEKIQNKIRNQMKKLLLTGIICLIAGTLSASDFSKIKINSEFQKLVLEDEMLMSGGVGIKDDATNQYIIAVGFTINKEKAKEKNPMLRMRTLKVAEAKAKKALTEFVYGVQHESKTILEKISKITVKTIDKNGQLQTIKTADKKRNFIEQIIERAEGKLTGHKKIGTWYSKDEDFVYTAVAITIPRNK